VHTSSVNLVPEAIRRAWSYRRKLIGWSLPAAFGASCLVALLGMEWIDRARAGTLDAESRRIAHALGDARQRETETTAESARVRSLVERARALRTKRSWSALLGVIGASLPRNTWMESLATDPPAPPPGQATVTAAKSREAGGESAPRTVTIEAPQRLVVNGVATEHSEIYALMTGLRDTGVFQSVTLLRSAADLQHVPPVVRFELTCDW
jgi:Tfp pilus assembly protein PilN